MDCLEDKLGEITSETYFISTGKIVTSVQKSGTGALIIYFRPNLGK